MEFSPKVEKLPNLKCQKGFETIGSSKPGAAEGNVEIGSKPGKDSMR